MARVVPGNVEMTLPYGGAAIRNPADALKAAQDYMANRAAPDR
jgi:hypothetical protein